VSRQASEKTAPPRELGLAASLGLGVACAAGSIFLRAYLAPFLGGEERVVALFPALLLASYYGGVVGGVSCLLTALVAAWYLFLGPPRSFVLGPHEGAGLLSLLVDGAVVVAGAVAIRRLVRRLREANEAEQLLSRELQHRVKNNLAVLEGLARLSARDSGNLATFLDRFLGRTKSLSAAQVLLSRDETAEADIDEVVAAVLAPFQTDGHLSWSGERLKLSSPQATALALCLHELATNAVKYGALSAACGKVRITWTKAQGSQGRILWEETGGPPAREPYRAGSGVRLLQRGVQLGRPAELIYRPEGLVWSSTFQTAPLTPPRSPKTPLPSG
jgi:two-component sensor histidine kinase